MWVQRPHKNHKSYTTCATAEHTSIKTPVDNTPIASTTTDKIETEDNNPTVITKENNEVSEDDKAYAKEHHGEIEISKEEFERLWKSSKN